MVWFLSPAMLLDESSMYGRKPWKIKLPKTHRRLDGMALFMCQACMMICPLPLSDGLWSCFSFHLNQLSDRPVPLWPTAAFKADQECKFKLPEICWISHSFDSLRSGWLLLTPSSAFVSLRRFPSHRDQVGHVMEWKLGWFFSRMLWISFAVAEQLRVLLHCAELCHNFDGHCLVADVVCCCSCLGCNGLQAGEYISFTFTVYMTLVQMIANRKL